MLQKRKVYLTPFLQERMLHIYIPDDLREDERVGVIYMFDGHNLFKDRDATYGTSWGLKDLFDKNGTKAIIVGIECNHKDNLRLFEFSPYSFYDPDFGQIEGWGKEIFSWIIDELKPFIDREYPTLVDRDNTSIGGSSMGGLMALYGAIAHSDTFSKALAISPYTFYVIDDILEDISKNKINPDTTIYLSYGSNEVRKKADFVYYTEQIFQIQRALDNRAHLLIHLFKGHDHSEMSWRREAKVWLKELNY